MAPERFEGRGDARSDVYSLGRTLYELLTLRPAFTAPDRPRLIHKILNDEPERPRALNPKAPRDLETVVLKAVARDPDHRYPTAGELAADLRRFGENRPVQARRVSLAERWWRWCRRNPVIAGLSTTVLLLLVLVAVVASAGYVREASLRSDAVRAQERAQEAEAEAHGEAERALRLADDERRARADEHRARQEARRNLYVANLRLGQQAWERGQIDTMVKLLEEADQRQPGDDDLRGFEWHYLWNLGHPEVPRFKGLSSRIQNVAFSSDGHRLATCYEEGTVKVWEVDSRKELLTFKVHTLPGTSRDAAFSADGRCLASASGDGTVQIWEVDSGKKIQEFKGQTGQVNGVTFSPNGRRLIARRLQMVQVWDVDSGTELISFQARTSLFVASLAFSPDGRHLAGPGYGGGTVQMWEADTGKELATFRTMTRNLISSVAYSPDGQRLAATSSNGTVKVWEVSSQRELLTLKGLNTSLFCVAFSPDGRLLAAGDGKGTVMVWEADSGKEFRIFKGQGITVTRLAFSPDGQRLAAGDPIGTVTVWEMALGKEFVTLGGNISDSSNVAFSPDGRRLAVGKRQTVQVWAVDSGEELLNLRADDGSFRKVAFSPDGKRLASCGLKTMVQVWEADSGKELPSFPSIMGIVNCLVFSPDGQCLAAADSIGMVQVWAADSGKELYTFQAQRRNPQIAFSPDGKKLVIGAGGTVTVCEADSGKKLTSFPAPIGSSNGLVFSPDGKRLAAGGLKVKVWEADSGKEHFRLETGGPAHAAFSPDGRRLATADFNGMLTLWEADTGKELLSLPGHTAHLNHIAFSPDGLRLAAVGFDGTVKVWEAVRVPSEVLRQRELRDRALDLVKPLFATHIRQAEVLQAIRENPRLAPDLRQAALSLAETYRLNPRGLYNLSLQVIRKPSASANEYDRALRQAEEACRLDPEDRNYLNTLGGAQYRLGQYERAVETLTRTEEFNATPEAWSCHVGLSFLAMAQYQLGHKELARATLARLRAVPLVVEGFDQRALRQLGASTVGLAGAPLGQGPFVAATALIPGRNDWPSKVALLAEAEALIEGKAAEPRE
jgi:WD40 repeat protein